MSKRNFILALAILTVIIAFGYKGNKAIMAYEADTIRTERVHQTTSDSVCMGDVEIDYPVAGPQCLMDSLRANINRALYDSFYYTEDSTHIVCFKGSLTDANKLAKFYSEAYYDNLKSLCDYNDSRTLQLEHNVGILKKYENKQVITYLVDSYGFFGGAHGAASSHAFMLDKATGKQLGYIIDTTQVEGMQELLKQGLTRYLTQEGDTLESDVVEILSLEDNNIIPLPDASPYFTAKGVTFVYGLYEIGPYVIGMPEFTISYKDIYCYLTDEAKKLVDMKNLDGRYEEFRW
ncbi:MAG: RsiV family protein [Prevotella bivia]|nr:RsiV family protein [Prevotella bivia]